MITKLAKVLISLCIFLLAMQIVNGQSQKVEVVDYHTSPCDRSSRNYKDRIVSELLYGDTLQIIIKTIGNCAGINSPRANLHSDTLWLFYYEGGRQEEYVDSNGEVYYLSEPDCDCCFEHAFTITGIQKIPKGVFIPAGTRPKKISDKDWQNYLSGEQEYYYKLLGEKFDVINGDTVNLTDKFGLKQGLWVKKPPKSRSEDEMEFPLIELEPEDEDFVKGERLHDSYKCFFVNDEIKTGEIIEYYQPYNIKKYHKIYTHLNTYTETFYDIDGNITKVIKSPPEEK